MDSPRERIKEHVEHAQETFGQGVESAREYAETASRKSREALVTTDDWVRDNPWLAVGIIGGVGLFVGVLVSQVFRGR